MSKLYLIPTPIGNLEDITFRGLRLLKEVDIILAEDTRVTKKLLSFYSINNYIASYHSHNEHKNLKKWTNEFLAYDYIGAPWPGQYTWRKRWKNETYQKAYINSKKNRVGNGGFSLRSRKFLNFSSAFNSTNGIPEDVFLCLINYESAKKNGIKFPSAEIAYNFSCEVPLGGFNLSKEIKNHHLDINQHFGWHGKRFLNSDKLIFNLSRPALAKMIAS